MSGEKPGHQEVMIPNIDPTMYMLDVLGITELAKIPVVEDPFLAFVSGPTFVVNDEMAMLLGEDKKFIQRVMYGSFVNSKTTGWLNEELEQTKILCLGLGEGKKRRTEIKITETCLGKRFSRTTQLRPKEFLSRADTFCHALINEINKNGVDSSGLSVQMQNRFNVYGINQENAGILLKGMRFNLRQNHWGFEDAQDRTFIGKNDVDIQKKKADAYLIQKALELAFVAMYGPKNIPSGSVDKAFSLRYPKYGETVWKRKKFERMTEGEYLEAINKVNRLLNTPNILQEVDVEELRYLLYICDALEYDNKTGQVRYIAEKDRPVADIDGKPLVWSVQYVAQKITTALEQANCVEVLGGLEGENNRYRPLSLERGLIGQVASVLKKGNQVYMRLWPQLATRGKKEKMPCWDCRVAPLCRRKNDVIRSIKVGIQREERGSGLLTRYLETFTRGFNPRPQYRGARPAAYGYFVDPEQGIRIPLNPNVILQLREQGKKGG